ncbi:MAG: hypothetical protein V3R87_12900 [Dehalococcoidia bacterium]
MGLQRLAKTLGITQPRAIALVHHLKLREDEASYREFRIGGILHKRYSSKALEQLQQAMTSLDSADVWQEYRTDLATRRKPGGR